MLCNKTLPSMIGSCVCFAQQYVLLLMRIVVVHLLWHCWSSCWSLLPSPPFSLHLFWSLFCLVLVLRCCWGGERSSFPTALLPCWARHPRSSGRMNADLRSQTERASLHKPRWRKQGKFNPKPEPKHTSSFIYCHSKSVCCYFQLLIEYSKKKLFQKITACGFETPHHVLGNIIMQSKL